MKPEVKIPDDVILISERYFMPVVIDRTWAYFILKNNMRIFGKFKYIFPVPDTDYRLHGKATASNFGIVFDGTTYFRYMDSKKRKYLNIPLRHEGLVKPEIIRNTMEVRHEKISFLKAKLIA